MKKLVRIGMGFSTGTLRDHSKIKNLIAGIALVIFAASTTVSYAAAVAIGDRSFENMTTNVVVKNFLGVSLLGTNVADLGAWRATESSLAGLGLSSISLGKKATQGGPTATDGTYDAKFSLGLGIGTTLSLFQTLGTAYQPNSKYTLSLDLDAGTALTLMGQASLELWAGSTMVTSLSGASLLNLLDSTAGFQTVQLIYSTGNSPPSGNIGVRFAASSLLTVGGNIYLDNMALDVQPVPEPKSWALVSLGLVSLRFFQRARARR